MPNIVELFESDQRQQVRPIMLDRMFSQLQIIQTPSLSTHKLMLKQCWLDPILLTTSVCFKFIHVHTELLLRFSPVKKNSSGGHSEQCDGMHSSFTIHDAGQMQH